MTTITGTWTDAANNPIANGTLVLTLSQDAVLSGTNQIAPKTVLFTLNSSGALPNSSQIADNSQLNPAGTTYKAQVIAVGGAQVWGAEVVPITGATFNFNSYVPSAAASVVTGVNNVVTNPTGSQTITQPTATSLTVTGAGTFSVTTTGGSSLSTVTTLTPATAGAADIGSASLPFGNLWVGNAATNNAKITGSFTAARTFTLPDTASDTFTLNAATQTFTNKTFDTAGAGNVLKINGTQVSAVTGTGSVALSNTPIFTTPSLGAATAASITSTGQVSTGIAGGFVDLSAGVNTTAMSPQSSATCTNVTGMSWGTANSKNYVLRCEIPVTLAASATLQFCLNNTSGTSATSYSLAAQGSLGAAGAWGEISTLAQSAWQVKTSASGVVNGTTVAKVWAQIQNASNSGGTLTLQTAADGTHNITVLANASCTLTQEN